jgi:hypothetical protein
VPRIETPADAPSGMHIAPGGRVSPAARRSRGCILAVPVDDSGYLNIGLVANFCS